MNQPDVRQLPLTRRVESTPDEMLAPPPLSTSPVPDQLVPDRAGRVYGYMALLLLAVTRRKVLSWGAKIDARTVEENLALGVAGRHGGRAGAGIDIQHQPAQWSML